MNCFTGIVPPPDISQKIKRIQDQFGDNRLEPHITLNPPAAVSDLDGWNGAIEEVCKHFPPFQITLPKTGQFGERVLFIDVQSAEIEELYKELKRAVRPFIRLIDKEDNHLKYNPHLTLGRKWCGFTAEDFADMKGLAEQYVSKETVSFTVTSIRLYHKPNPGGRYQKIQDISLGR